MSKIVEENATIFAIFPIRDVFLCYIFFFSEKDPGIVKVVSYIFCRVFTIKNLSKL